MVFLMSSGGLTGDSNLILYLVITSLTPQGPVDLKVIVCAASIRPLKVTDVVPVIVISPAPLSVLSAAATL